MRSPGMLPLLLLPALLFAGTLARGQDLGAAREAELVRIVRQDCGACHGLRLTGGLGPALTSEALSGMPLAVVTATIVHGRPGTPMPSWRGLLSDAEAGWIAARLVSGFPEERSARR